MTTRDECLTAYSKLLKQCPLKPDEKNSFELARNSEVDSFYHTHFKTETEQQLAGLVEITETMFKIAEAERNKRINTTYRLY